MQLTVLMTMTCSSPIVFTSCAGAEGYFFSPYYRYRQGLFQALRLRRSCHKAAYSQRLHIGKTCIMKYTPVTTVVNHCIGACES